LSPPDLIAIFGPTGVGKTAVALELAHLLRARGENPVAISADALQVYRGLGVLSGAPDAEQQACLEHRLVGIADPTEEFSAGRFATLAHSEIDALRAEGRRPVLLGGTGLYLRAAICELDLRPPVPAAVRQAVEADLASRGPAALHAELPPADREGVHPNDRKRIARITELLRVGSEPARDSDQLWTERPRVPTTLVGLTLDPEEHRERIERRVGAMAGAGAGAGQEARQLDALGASRTARAAIGFAEFAADDLEAVKTAHWQYARRQITWMRKLPDIHRIDRTGRTDPQVAAEIVRLAGLPAGGSKAG